jgi:hypothetical protein
MRERQAKDDATARAAEMKAEFERQIATAYSYNSDEIWKAATEDAEAAVREAKKKIAAQCRKRGIPPEFAPGLNLNWYGRGENALKERRDELRKAAYAQIEAMSKNAKLEIQRQYLTAHERLLAGGLESEEARAFLETIPAPAMLMPALKLPEIEAATKKSRSYCDDD